MRLSDRIRRAFGGNSTRVRTVAKRAKRRRRRRWLAMEPLERRELLTVTATVSVSDTTLHESSTGSETFTITVSGLGQNETACVEFTRSGTADFTIGTDGDYTESSHCDWSSTETDYSIYFYGSGSDTYTIEPIADKEYEGNETVVLTITGGTWCDSQEEYAGDISGGSSATMTIDDDDEWEISVATTAGKEKAGEPSTDGEFTITRKAVGDEPMDRTYDIDVSYGFITSGTLAPYATAGTDFTDTSSGSVTLSAPSQGQDETETVTIDVTDDQVAEKLETVEISLSDAVPGGSGCCSSAPGYPITNARARFVPLATNLAA